MKKEKELKKIFSVIKDDPGDIDVLREKEKEWQTLALDNEIPKELSFSEFGGFIQHLLKININFGMERLREKQEEEKIQRDMEQDFQKDDEEDVQEGPVTVVRKKKGEDKNEEDVETLKKQLEEFKLLSETLKGASEELKVLRPAHKKLEEEKTTLEEQLKQAGVTISDLEQQAGDFQEANKALYEKGQENEQLKKDKEALQSENEQLKRDKIREVQILEQTNKLLEARLEEARKEIEELTRHCRGEATASMEKIPVLDNFVQAGDELIKENTHLKEKNKELQEELDELTKEAEEIPDLKSQVVLLKKQLEAKPEISDLQKQLDEKTKESARIPVLEKELTAVKAQMETLSMELTDVKIERDTLKIQADRVPGLENDVAGFQKKVGAFQTTQQFKKKIQELQERMEKPMDKNEKNEKHDLSLSDLLQRQLRESNALNQDLNNQIMDLKAKVKGLEKDLELAKAKAFEEVQAHNTAYVKLISNELMAKREEIQELRQELKSKPPTEGLKLTVLDDVKTEERAGRASLLGWFTLIPPLAFLFWPLAPKRKWTDFKLMNMAKWPLGMIFNLIIWVILAFGILIAVHNFTPKSWNVRPYTEKTLAQVETSAKKIGLEDVYLTILPEKVPDKSVEKPVDLNEYILKSEASKNLDTAVAAKDSEWNKKLEDYILKADADKQQEKAVLEIANEWQEKLKLYVLKTQAEAEKKEAVSTKHKTWDAFFEKEKDKWQKQLAQEKENASHFDSKAAELQNKLQQSLNQVDELSKKLKEATQSNGELDGELAELQNKYQRALDQMNDLKQGTKYAKFAPFLDKIPTIQSVGGYIELPADAPKGTANWFIKLTESFLAIEKAKVEPGFIALHYFGDTLKAYKGSKIYFVVEKDDTK